MLNKIKNIEADFISALQFFSKEIVRLHDNNRECGSLENEGFILSYRDESINPKIGISDLNDANFYSHELLALRSLSGARINDLKEYINL